MILVNLETSTLNVMLALIAALQCWMVRELYRLKAKVALLMSHCVRCPKNLKEPE